MAREGKEGGVFFADVIEDADGGLGATVETDDLATGAAEFALKGNDTVHGDVEVGFEERFENVDQSLSSNSILYDLSCPLFFSMDAGDDRDLVGRCCYEVCPKNSQKKALNGLGLDELGHDVSCPYGGN